MYGWRAHQLDPLLPPSGSCVGPKVIFLTEMFSIEPNMATSGTHDQKCSDMVYLCMDFCSVDKSHSTKIKELVKKSDAVRYFQKSRQIDMNFS